MPRKRQYKTQSIIYMLMSSYSNPPKITESEIDLDTMEMRWEHLGNKEWGARKNKGKLDNAENK